MCDLGTTMTLSLDSTCHSAVAAHCAAAEAASIQEAISCTFLLGRPRLSMQQPQQNSTRGLALPAQLHVQML